MNPANVYDTDNCGQMPPTKAGERFPPDHLTYPYFSAKLLASEAP